jgi:hypothetical protein
MPKAKRDLRRCLIRKFGFSEVAGSKHEALALIVDERKVATTRFSRSWREIDDSMLRQIARELWVSSRELKQMCDCTIDRDGYLQKLRSEGHTV